MEMGTSIYTYIGGLLAIGIVLLDYVAMRVFPESWFDDGGINDKMFRGMSVHAIARYYVLDWFCRRIFI